MTRRNFLSSIFAGAAALVGVKMLPKEEPKITFGPNAKVKVTETPTKAYTAFFGYNQIADMSGNGRHFFGPADCPLVVLPFSPESIAPEEVSAVHAYLNKKYGSNLPVDHVAS